MVLNTINELSEDEKDALLMLRNETPESVYDNKNGEKPHPFIENWEEMVRKDLGWTDIDIEIYVGTWNTPSELNTMYYNASNSNTSLGCTCRSFWGCPGFSFCQTYSCDTPPNGGCGIVGTANCLGLCPLDMEPGGFGNNIYENLSSKYVC